MKKEFLRKRVGQYRYPYRLYGYPTHIIYTLKGGYNMLTKCKSFADALIIQTCGNNKQLDYATPRSTNCACSAVFKHNRFNSA